MWCVERVINFGESGQFRDGYARFGFHDNEGTQYVVANDFNWVGALFHGDSFQWTAGERQERETKYHFDVEVREPTFVAQGKDGSLLVAMKSGVLKIDPEKRHAAILIDTEKDGIDFAGNAVPGDDGSIWINDVLGRRIVRYDGRGGLIEVVGTGKPGFTTEEVPFERASFEWIYDIRKGPDGNIYVLDSRNYAVRMLDLKQRSVRLIAGTGEPGYSGDGGDPLQAQFGGAPDEQFDGPWSLSLDEYGDIYVGDTQNHVVRMIDRRQNTIGTIAGNPTIVPNRANDPDQHDPFEMNLPRICGLDYSGGRIFIPEWDGDLIVLKREGRR